MRAAFRLIFGSARRRWALALGVPVLLAGCRHDVFVVPTTDYYPVVVGTYRTYAVADSSWKDGVLTASGYQFRERVSEQFTDAAGKTAYRVVRSRRDDASASWADDSVLVVQPLPQAVLVTRDNQRTVELIYPPQAGKGWNANAFSVGPFSPDTITNLTRFYGPMVGGAFTTPPAGGQAAKTYPETVSTYSTLPSPPTTAGGVPDVNVYYQRGLYQVYAKGVGLVLRRRFTHNTYITDPNGNQNVTPGMVQNGFSRSEVLVDKGTL